MYRIAMGAKSATIYVSGVRPGIRLGPHTTSSREHADILSYNDENAGEALAQGR
jgi:hypothetical protein